MIPSGQIKEMLMNNIMCLVNSYWQKELNDESSIWHRNKFIELEIKKLYPRAGKLVKSILKCIKMCFMDKGKFYYTQREMAEHFQTRQTHVSKAIKQIEKHTGITFIRIPTKFVNPSKPKNSSGRWTPIPFSLVVDTLSTTFSDRVSTGPPPKKLLKKSLSFKESKFGSLLKSGKDLSDVNSVKSAKIVNKKDLSVLKSSTVDTLSGGKLIPSQGSRYPFSEVDTLTPQINKFNQVVRPPYLCNTYIQSYVINPYTFYNFFKEINLFERNLAFENSKRGEDVVSSLFSLKPKRYKLIVKKETPLLKRHQLFCIKKDIKMDNPKISSKEKKSTKPLVENNLNEKKPRRYTLFSIEELSKSFVTQRRFREYRNKLKEERNPLPVKQFTETPIEKSLPAKLPDSFLERKRIQEERDKEIRKQEKIQKIKDNLEEFRNRKNKQILHGEEKKKIAIKDFNKSVDHEDVCTSLELTAAPRPRRYVLKARKDVPGVDYASYGVRSSQWRNLGHLETFRSLRRYLDELIYDQTPPASDGEIEKILHWWNQIDDSRCTVHRLKNSSAIFKMVRVAATYRMQKHEIDVKEFVHILNNYTTLIQKHRKLKFSKKIEFIYLLTSDYWFEYCLKSPHQIMMDVCGATTEYKNTLSMVENSIVHYFYHDARPLAEAALAKGRKLIVEFVDHMVALHKKYYFSGLKIRKFIDEYFDFVRDFTSNWTYAPGIRKMLDMEELFFTAMMNEPMYEDTWAITREDWEKKCREEEELQKNLDK